MRRVKKKIASNPEFKFYFNLRRKSTQIIRRQTGETGKPIRYIGCTRDFWISHLESQFTDRMSWDNYGTEWEVDHIIPISTVSKTDINGLIKLFPLVKYKTIIKT